MQLRELREAARGLFRIRAGVDGLLGLVAVLGFLGLFRRGFFDDLDLGRVLRLRDHVRRVRVDEADDHVDEAALAGLHVLVGRDQMLQRGRVMRQRAAHGVEAFLDALGDADLAFAREQFDGAHLAHVHAHRVGRAAEFGIERGQRGGGFLDRLFIGRRAGLGREQGLRCPVPSRTPECPCR